MVSVIAMPVNGRAQEATVSGTVTDSTGSVLPGVTVTALHEASGNIFQAVTDERGGYRIPARTGVYKITAELSGFSTLIGSLELAVGQQAVMNLRMLLEGVEESVTVTGDAPLVDITQSTLGGRIDRRQMEEMPINGRNWLQLTPLSPGSRATESREAAPVRREYTGTVFQLEPPLVSSTYLWPNRCHWRPDSRQYRRYLPRVERLVNLGLGGTVAHHEVLQEELRKKRRHL
jgi:hypothetical protein